MRDNAKTMINSPIEIKNPSRYMTLTYVISLSLIALLSIAVHLMLDKVIIEQSQTGRLVNVSGQQRMLSQRVSMFTLEYLMSGSSEDALQAKTALDKMLYNHNFLLREHYEAVNAKQPSPLSEDLLNMYFGESNSVQMQLEKFEQNVLQALASRYNDEQERDEELVAGFFTLAKQPLLSALHEVVEQYERESLDKVNSLRLAQTVVLSIIILTILVEALLVFRPMVRRVSAYAIKLQHEANYDLLSGLVNRRAFYMIANKTFSASKRYHRTMSTILFDIDNFKHINDEFGHDMGDKAIKHVADLLVGSCRNADVVARFGGEEFIILLPNTNLQEAEMAAEKLRKALEQSPLKVEDISLPITMSGGVSTFLNQFTDIDQQIKEADNALYNAKRDGKNKVCVADF